MRRVVVTGLGIVSSIGNNKDEVVQSLKDGRSGIEYCAEYEELGFRSHIHGSIKLNIEDELDRKLRRFMGDGAAYNYLAMAQAIEDSGLTEKDISNERTGIIMGSGGPSTQNMLQAFDTLREKGARRVGPFMVPRTMSNTNTATLAVPYKIKGMNYTITSACATSAHCIGHGAELIQWDKQDIVFAGGGEELHWTITVLFDAMPALSSKYNDRPAEASRAFDTGRDGFIISGGGGVVVLEELEHAKARGAKILAELIGYGTSADAHHITSPPEDGEGAQRAMAAALAQADISPGQVDYINAHSTATGQGDLAEVNAVKALFGNAVATLSMSSTKSAIGHLLGAAGAVEAIFSVLAMLKGVVPPTLNLDNPDPECSGIDLVAREARERPVRVAMSNAFGFGGVNASLVFGPSPA